MDRNNEIKIRLSDDELGRLKAKVSRTKLSREEFCRQALAGVIIKTAVKEDSYMLLTEIRSISRNLSKMAAKSPAVDDNHLRYELTKLNEIEKQIVNKLNAKSERSR